MYCPNGRGHSSAADARARSTGGCHPNWSHPDHDACGTGFIARLGGDPSHDIIQFALTALERLTHRGGVDADGDRKSTRLNSSHLVISYAVFCLKKKKKHVVVLTTWQGKDRPDSCTAQFPWRCK